MKRASDRARVYAVIEHLGFKPDQVPPLKVTRRPGAVEVRLSSTPGVDFVIELSRERFEQLIAEILTLAPGALREMMLRDDFAGVGSFMERATRIDASANAGRSPFDN